MALLDIIACIDAAIDDVELPKFGFIRHEYEILRFRLRVLKRFASTFCSSNLGGEDSLSALLVTLSDHVPRISCLARGWSSTPSECLPDIFELKTMSYWHSTRSRCCTTDDVLEMMTSTLEALLDLRSTSVETLRGDEYLLETIEELEEQMSFLKGFVTLAGETSVVESLRDLFSQAVSLYSRVSYFLFTFKADDFAFGVSRLLQERNTMYATLSRGLSKAKLLSMDDDDNDAAFTGVKRFPYPPISYLWHLLRLEKCAILKKEVKRRLEKCAFSFEDLQEPMFGTLTRAYLDDGGDDDGAFIAGQRFLDSIMSYLWHLHHQQELYVAIRSLRAILKREPSNLNVKMKQQIIGAVCDAGAFICSLHTSQKCISVQNLLHRINAILTQFPKTTEEFSASIMDDLKTSLAQRSNIATSITDEGIVGFHEEGIVAVDQLTRGSKQLRVVAIVGMPGQGKTTFATMVYNNPDVFHYFHVRAWSPVSQVVDKNKVLRELLNQTDPAKCSETPEQDLADGLRKSLKGKRYLIFLDDVWDIQVWGQLKETFPDDDVGSRIILTSRQHDVAPHDLMVDGKPHCLHPLSEAETMDLLHRKLSRSGYGLLPPMSHNLRMKIAEKCRGLPLIIVILAGLLKSVELEGWDEILDGLSHVSSTEQCRSTLELSYRHLPAYLRPCLLYFGAIRKDRVVSVRRLVRLWIAEGFVQGDELNSLEDAAEGYLSELISRSLIMVGKQRTLGGLKAWKIHDLIHDFCEQKAKDDHFFQFLKGRDEVSAYNDQVHNLQRLCIDSEVEHVRKSKLFVHAHSLIFNSQVTNFSEEKMNCLYITYIRFSKLVKVLDLEQMHFVRLPDEIKQLANLSFLAMPSSLLEIPEWIGNLSNLETFVFGISSFVYRNFSFHLPKSFCNLQKLRYLYLGERSLCSFICLPESKLDSSSTLCKLDRISGLTVRHRNMESTVRMFPNIRKLGCTLQWEEDDCNDLVVPSILSRIVSLNLCYQEPVTLVSNMFDRVSFPENLKKLTLKRFTLSWRNMSTIGELPNLEVLKLIWQTFEGETWEMKEGEFSKLRFLELNPLNLVRWRTECDEYQLDRLQKLVLTQCSDLEEMPSCLDNISTLEIIELSHCHSTTLDLVKQIEERRKELMGDSGMKIITN